jgi:hypothetical protein
MSSPILRSRLALSRRSRRLVQLLACLFLVTLVGAVEAEAFTSAYGGPTGNRSSDVAVGSRPGVVWQSSLAATPYTVCGPVAAGGRVFIAARVGGARLNALDAATGAALWTGPEVFSATHGDCPAVDATRVIQNLDARRVQAYNAGTGSVLWTRDLAGDDLSAPVMADGQVFVARQDHGTWPRTAVLYALNAVTGATLWSQPVDYGTRPVVLVGDGTVVAVGQSPHSPPGASTVTALDTATGAVKWTYAIPSGESASVVASDGRVFMHRGSSVRSQLVAIDASSGATSWSREYAPGISLTADASRVYVCVPVYSERGLRALDPATGALIWDSPHMSSTYAECGAPARFADLVVTNGRTYRAADGSVVRSGPQSWNGSAWPVLDGGRLLAWVGGKLVAFRDDEAPTITASPANAAALNDATPEITWKAEDAELGGVGVATTQVRLDNTVIAAQPRGTFVPGNDLTEGSHTITVESTDKRGNAQTATRTFDVDLTAPGTPALTLPGQYAKDTFTVQGHAADPGGGDTKIEFTLDGATAGVASACHATCSFTFYGLTDGTHSIHAVAIDAAGNRSDSSVTRTFNADRSAPAAAVQLSPAAGATVAPGQVDLRWQPATDGGSGIAGYAVLLDGIYVLGERPQTQGTITVGPGPHTWQVVTTDRVGNSSVSAPVSFTAWAAPDPTPTPTPPPTSTPTPPTGPGTPVTTPPAQGLAARGPACREATPARHEYRDPIGDTVSAPDLSLLWVDVAGDCTVTVTYGLDSNGLLTSDSLSLMVDADGDTHTGNGALQGADRFLTITGPVSQLRASLGITDPKSSGVLELVQPSPVAEAAQRRLIVVTTSVSALGLHPGRTARLRFGSGFRGTTSSNSDFAPGAIQPGFELTVQFRTAGAGAGSTNAPATAKPVPTLRGKPKVGAKLTCVAPKEMSGVAAYAWLRSGRPIRGAKRATLKLQRADAGKRVSCRVRGRIGATTVTTSSAGQRVRR